MRKAKPYILITAGILLLVLGLALLLLVEEPTYFLTVLPYVCVGIGCGIFGNGMAQFLMMRRVKKHPGLKKQMEIEEKDERNIAVSNRAKAKAYDLMIYAFGALMLSFLFMDVEVTAILLFIFVYLLVQGCAVYYRIKYEQEM